MRLEIIELTSKRPKLNFLFIVNIQKALGKKGEVMKENMTRDSKRKWTGKAKYVEMLSIPGLDMLERRMCNHNLEYGGEGQPICDYTG